MSHDVESTVERFFEVLDFVINSVIFVLIGLQALQILLR